MAENSIRVKVAVKNRTVKKEMEDILSFIYGFSLVDENDPGTCDLLIMEIGEDLRKEFLAVQSAIGKGAAESIFVTAAKTDPEMIIQALRAGVKEFFSQPLKREEVIASLEKFRDNRLKAVPGNRPKGKIVNLLGSKGGVGTTTIAVNLATGLRELEGSPSVALLDVNPLLGDLPIFLDIKASLDWGELVKNISRVDSTFLMSIMAKHETGIFVLPSATMLDGVMATREVIDKLLGLLKSSFDYVVVDSGNHANNTSLKILTMADQVLLVSLLDLPCLTNTRRLLKTFQDLGFPRKEQTEVVVNRFLKNSLIGMEEAEKSLGRKIYWSIPNDYRTAVSAINQGKPLNRIDPKGDLAKNFRMLAQQVSGKAKKN